MSLRPPHLKLAARLQSFFAWHIEDADLYSVNFLHWGAPKVWYCVAPSTKARFERLAAGMHPDAFRACKGFLRHKDILISPSILKQYGVSYSMVRLLHHTGLALVSHPLLRPASDLSDIDQSGHIV